MFCQNLNNAKRGINEAVWTPCAAAGAVALVQRPLASFWIVVLFIKERRFGRSGSEQSRCPFRGVERKVDNNRGFGNFYYKMKYFWKRKYCVDTRRAPGGWGPGGACREGRRFNAGLTSAARREDAPDQRTWIGRNIYMVENIIGWSSFHWRSQTKQQSFHWRRRSYW